jgi:pyruvate kinase
MTKLLTPLRRTKIVVTLGPSLDNADMLDKVMQAGADVFRANFSHGKSIDHENRINAVRAAAKKAGREVAIFADLQGPKIRVSRFKDKKVFLKEGAEFILDAELENDMGDEHHVGIDYKELVNDVYANDTLLLDDGRVVFTVNKIEGKKIICTVKVGGELSNNKGINRMGGGLSAEALTDKDKEDLKTAIKLDVDYIAISFPRCAADMEYAKQLIKEAGGVAGVIAKVERAEAVIPETLDEIINVSDAIMVARGDLGVEIGDCELPAVQKLMIRRARALNKPVITATQMMETMIHNSIPTRAEVFDVANAVLDNTDAVMLSAETATGDHPDVVVKAMSNICLGSEKQPETMQSNHRMECHFNRPDEAIAMASVYVANHFDIKAIIALTVSGSTPLWMSRIRTGTPIFALSNNLKTLRKVCLYRDVYPVAFDRMTAAVGESINKAVADHLKAKGILQSGDLVLITRGDQNEQGYTNALKIYRVE